MRYLSLRSLVSMIELEDKNGLPIQYDKTKKKTNDTSRSWEGNDASFSIYY